jgi:hypothetical protein
MINKVLCEVTDPRNKTVTYYESVNEHILDGHPELAPDLPHLPIEVITDPDWIREGRNPKNTELYFKLDYVNNTEFYGTMVSTKDIVDGEGNVKKTIITTTFNGKDKVDCKMKWSKTKGNI